MKPIPKVRLVVFAFAAGCVLIIANIPDAYD
jgi:hypothetical protein